MNLGMWPFNRRQRCVAAALVLFSVFGISGCDKKAASKGPDADMVKAYAFLEKNATINETLLGEPEPELARISQNGSVCHVVCGFHVFYIGISDTEFGINLEEINPAKVEWHIDGLGRGFISFASRDGGEAFTRRSRPYDPKAKKPTGPWSDWEAVDTALCRVIPNKDSIQRVADAFVYLARKCGAQDNPY